MPNGATMYDYFLYTAIVVYIVDLSGFTETLLEILSRYKGQRVTSFKPFTCSLCLSWWVLLVWSFVTGVTIEKIALSALCSFMSYPICQILQLIQELIIAIIKRLYTWIDKI